MHFFAQNTSHKRAGSGGGCRPFAGGVAAGDGAQPALLRRRVSLSPRPLLTSLPTPKVCSSLPTSACWLGILLPCPSQGWTCIRDYLRTVMEKNPGSRCHVCTILPINKPRENQGFMLFSLVYMCKTKGLRMDARLSLVNIPPPIERFKNGCGPVIG